MTENTLTPEQLEFLAECEEEFKDRYTEKDPDYMKLASGQRKKPPIVDPWYNKPRRPNYDWTRQNRDHGGRRNNNTDRRVDRNRYDRHFSRNEYQRNQRPYRE